MRPASEARERGDMTENIVERAQQSWRGCSGVRMPPYLRDGVLSSLGLLVLLSLVPFRSGGAEPGQEILSLAIRSPLERAGDYDALAAAWLEAIAKYPEDFRSELLARRLNALRPSLRDEPALVPLIEKTRDVRGLTRMILMDALEDLYRGAGREDERKRLEAEKGFLTRWLVIGPFGKGQSSLFLRSFPPEKEQNIESSYRDGWQELKWRKIVREAPEPMVNPLRHVYPWTGIAYLLSQVKAEREMDAVLHRGSTESIQIWLNGTLVADDDLTGAYVENRRSTGVRLAKGWNRILVKARTGFWIRLGDDSGSPFTPGTFVEEEELAVHPLEACPPAAREGHRGALATWRDWLDTLAAGARKEAPEGAPEAGDPRILADAHMAMALIYGFYGRDELAVKESEEAQALAPKEPFTLYHAGHVCMGAGYLPPSISKNRSKSSFEAVLAADPDFVPAYERVARFLEEDSQYIQAAAKMKEGLEKQPGFLPALLRLKSIYSRRDWKDEEMEIVKRIEGLSPSSALPPTWWGDHFRRLGNLSQAASFYRKALDLDKRRSQLLTSLAGVEEMRGLLKESEEALRAAVRLHPSGEESRQVLQEFLAAGGRVDEALTIARGLAQENPLRPDYEKDIARLLERAGKDDEALASYRRALALEPGDVSLQRYLAVKKGSTKSRDDDFWAPYDEKLEDWIPRVPAEGPLVEKADALVVLDICVGRIERDGSYSEYVHQASKAITEGSKESLANVRTGDEILLIRTIIPGGEILEPVAAEGKQSFVMPGVSPGAYVEYAYRADNQRAQGRPFRSRSFFFQDTQFKSPFILSRYVVLLPDGFDLATIENNLHGADAKATAVQFAKVEKKVRDLEKGGKAVIYEAREVPRLEPARFLPPTEEYIPNVEILEKRSWEDVAAIYRDRYAAAARITPEISAAARQATAGIEDPLERAKALYKYANDLVTTESGSGTAVTVLLEKGGDRNVLYKALCDAAGIPARWAYLRPQEAWLARTDWSYPRPEMFSYPYLRVELEKREPIYISLSQRSTPFGRLPEYLQGGKCLMVGSRDDKIDLLPSPDLDGSASTVRGSLGLGKDVEVTANIEIITRAFLAFAQKDRLRTLPAFQKDVVLRQIANQIFPGAKVQSAELQGLDDPEKPLAFALQLTAPKMLRQSGDDFLLKPILQPAQLVRSFAGRSQREHPFHFRSQVIVRDSIRIAAGDSYAIGRTPSDLNLAGALGTYSLRYKVEGNEVAVTREMTLLAGRISPQDFTGFVDFCQKIDAAEQENVVFSRKAAEKP